MRSAARMRRVETRMSCRSSGSPPSRVPSSWASIFSKWKPSVLAAASAIVSVGLMPGWRRCLRAGFAGCAEGPGSAGFAASGAAAAFAAGGAGFVARFSAAVGAGAGAGAGTAAAAAGAGSGVDSAGSSPWTAMVCSTWASRRAGKIARPRSRNCISQ